MNANKDDNDAAVEAVINSMMNNVPLLTKMWNVLSGIVASGTDLLAWNETTKAAPLTIAAMERLWVNNNGYDAKSVAGYIMFAFALGRIIEKCIIDDAGAKAAYKRTTGDIFDQLKDMGLQ